MRDRLVTRVLALYYETPLQGDVLDQVVTQLRRELPNGISRDVLFESVRGLAGVTLTELEATRLAWRLAGNIPRLRTGEAATPWATQREDEWVPLQITQALEGRDRRDKRGYHFTFRVLAGSSCPDTLNAFWSRAFIRMVARRIGFGAPWGRYPFHRGPELVGLRLLGEVSASRSVYRPTFHEVAAPSGLIKWNRERVLRQRLRIIPCPLGFQHACHRCAVGYDQCVAGTHRSAYVQRTCDLCGTEAAYFDPDRQTPHCISCDDISRTRSVNA